MIISALKHTTSIFPCGEMHVKLDVSDPMWNDVSSIGIEWIFQKNEDIIELLLYCNALEEKGISLDTLSIPYFPFGRQDRVAVNGESFSLRVFANLINGLNANQVIVMDPHSDVIGALVKRCKIIHQHEIFSHIINKNFADENYFLISPDGGALKKIYKLAPLLNMCDGVFECSKLRSVKTGEITETRVHAGSYNLINSTCIIVDDICDGGRTFIEIAKILKNEKYVKRVVLCVTHGFFTQGIKPFDGLIDEIYTRHGRKK